MTAPPAAIDGFLADVTAVAADPRPGEARVAGAHLEGPFINPRQLGAQPPFAQPIDLGLARGWLATGMMRVVTLAPELDGAADLIALVQARQAPAAVAGEEQAVLLHEAVDALGVDGRLPGGAPLAPEKRRDPPVPVGWALVDETPDAGRELEVALADLGPAPRPRRLRPLDRNRAGDAERVASVDVV